MKIAIICAMEEEAALLTQWMADAAQRVVAGVRFTEGVIANHEVTLCLAGIGKSNAAATAQLVVCESKPDILINIGLAGNCTGLPLGGVVIADKLVYHDVNMDFIAEGAPFLHAFTPTQPLANHAADACTALGIKYVRGTVATGDIFVNSNAVRGDIVSRTDCACVEMEGAAIAHIAHKNGMQYAIIKIMSDNADESALDVFHETLPAGAYCETSVGIISRMLKALE